ncbi:hypothetical protein BpHYR1_030444 [Brachionus plicatilis]|uniref:Uncharacterized protein n=1 Tax=Brachionus plicatilis TaxID=10195 RepID=A0A3M7QTL2_BRAPC|nr:hypothetical protein BpHYR1_030444 [Brachionus plicatilis]
MPKIKIPSEEEQSSQTITKSSYLNCSGCDLINLFDILAMTKGEQSVLQSSKNFVKSLYEDPTKWQITKSIGFFLVENCEN